MTQLDDWLSHLSYSDFPKQLLRAGDSVGARPYATEIEEMLSTDGGIEADAVFSVGELPTVCVFDAGKLSEGTFQRVEQIRQRIWNQNLVSVVLLVGQDHLAAYAVNERNATPDVLSRADVKPRGRWSAYEIESGFVKDRLSSWFDPQHRVDQRLLANLRQVVDHLEKHGLTSGDTDSQIASPTISFPSIL